MEHLTKGTGAVAILDALGMSMRSLEQAETFVKSRNEVLGLLGGKLEGVNLSDKVKQFTFGDTILLTLDCELDSAIPGDCADFMLAIRKFLVDSLQRGVLLRGAIAIGDHYTSDASNTVMGPAVDDAAAWYEQAEWIGLNLTPLASLKAEQWRTRPSGPRANVITDYEVPLKKGNQRLKAINWPKVLFVRGIAPVAARAKPREYLLSKLSAQPIPIGVEHKYTNTLAYFDHIVLEQRLLPIDSIKRDRTGRK